jgi:hypothetical protein
MPNIEVPNLPTGAAHWLIADAASGNGFPPMNGDRGDRELVHPKWCWAEACTADEPEDEVDWRYHRSKPQMIETDDPQVTLVVHLGANRDGSDPYVELAELEQPLAVPFWMAEPAAGRELMLPLDQVDALRHVLGSMVRGAR